MSLAVYLGLVHRSEQTLAESLRTVGEGHAAEVDVLHTCDTLATWSDQHVAKLQPFVDRYGEVGDDEPERMHADGLAQVRPGGLGLVRDLQDLMVLATLVQTSWTVVHDAAQALRDRDLMQTAQSCNAETSRQLTWFNTRLKAAAPQALLVPQ